MRERGNESTSRTASTLSLTSQLLQVRIEDIHKHYDECCTSFFEIISSKQELRVGRMELRVERMKEAVRSVIQSQKQVCLHTKILPLLHYVLSSCLHDCERHHSQRRQQLTSSLLLICSFVCFLLFDKECRERMMRHKVKVHTYLSMK